MSNWQSLTYWVTSRGHDLNGICLNLRGGGGYKASVNIDMLNLNMDFVVCVYACTVLVCTVYCVCMYCVCM